MSSQRLGVCARRAPLATKSHLTPLVSTTFTSPHNQSRRRAYATVNKRHRALYDVWGEIPAIPKALFTKWFDTARRMEKQERGEKWLRFTDQQYFAALELFREAAPLTGADWASKLKKELRPDPKLLNDIGCVLARHTPQTQSLEGKVRVTTVMQWAMFSGAAHLGCETSALSMARWIAHASFEDKDVMKRPLFRPTMDLHRKMLEEGKPLALCIEGELLVRTGKTDAAIRILERAHKEANSTVIWWPEICKNLGIAHSLNNNIKAALKYWGEAVVEGNVEALMDIYKTTQDEEVRSDSIYKLACRGYPVLRTMAMLEGFKAHMGEFDTPEEKVFQDKWAKQWEKMSEYDMKVRKGLLDGGFDDPSQEELFQPLPEEMRNALLEKEKQGGSKQ